MAVIRSRRVRDAGMGGLVQQSAALGAHRQHPAGRSRGTLLRHAGTTCRGSVTQTKWPPTNPGRFTGPESKGLRLEAVEYAMAVRISAAVQRLQGSVAHAESRPSTISPITLEVKQTGERSGGKPQAAFDVAGAGNVARSRCCDTRKRKGESTGNTNIDLNRRASPRP